MTTSFEHAFNIGDKVFAVVQKEEKHRKLYDVIRAKIISITYSVVDASVWWRKFVDANQKTHIYQYYRVYDLDDSWEDGTIQYEEYSPNFTMTFATKEEAEAKLKEFNSRK